MKRLSLLMLILCFVLCGCKTQETVSPVTKGIDFTLNVTCGENKYDVSVLVDKGGCMSATVNSPEAIKGMKIISNDFETLAEYKNLKYTYNDEFTENNCIVTVYNILSSLEEKQLSVKKGENCIVSGKFSDEEYIFTFSPAGLPIELNIASKNLKAVFNDIKLI